MSAAASGGASPNSNQDNATNRIADINPEDIENIEILKGASASAIFGSRGAAGVIIITTKKGKSGKTKINFSSIRRLPFCSSIYFNVRLDRMFGKNSGLCSPGRFLSCWLWRRTILC